MSGAHDAVSSARPWVNRETELGTLERVLDETVSGRRRFVLLSGEPGIGKTRFADEVSRRARARGVRSLWGRCWEGAGAPAYWPWVQILRAWVRDCPPQRLAEAAGDGAPWLGALVTELREHLPASAHPPPADDSESARSFLFDAVGDLLVRAAAHEPLLLVIDDLHWADRPSLLLLQSLVRALREVRLLVLATCRAPVFGAGAETTCLLDDLRRESLEIPLGGFRKDEVAMLLAAAMPLPPPRVLVQRVYDATEGNPFYVDEIARGLAGEGLDPERPSDAVRIPEGIRQAIRWRLSSLAPESVEVLLVAAVIGRSFDLRLLRDLTGCDGVELVKRLGDASRLDVVRPSSDVEGRYVFLRGLVQESLYEDVPAARRAGIHRRIGEILETQTAVEAAELPMLAHHFARAAGVGCAEKAVAYGFRAGETAEAQFAWEEGVRCFAAVLGALDHLASAPGDPRREAWIRLGENQARAGDRRAAAGSFRRAIELARTSGDAARLARAALGLVGSPGAGGADEATGRVDGERLAILEEALAGLPKEDSPLRARLLGALAVSPHGVPGSRHRRGALSDEAVSMARRIDDGATLAAALASRRYARWNPDDLEDRQRVASETLRLAREAGDGEREVEALQGMVWDALETAQAETAWRHAALHERLARRLRQPLHLGITATFRSLRAMLEGRYVEARRLAERAFELGREAENPAAADLFAAQRLVLAWEEGRLAELEDAMAVVLSRQPDVPAARTAVPLVWSELGRVEAARVELEQLAADAFRDLPRDPTWPVAVACLSLACVNLAEAHRWRRLYDPLEPYRDRLVLVGPPPAATLGPVAWYLGRLAHFGGEAEVAAGHFERALGIAERLRAPGFRARALVGLAAVRAGLGDRVSAGRLLDEGRSIARALGMRALEAEARTLAGRIGRPATQSAGASLRHEGDFWRIGWEGRSVRVEDAKGIRHLARLLRSPGTEVHVADLMRGLAPVAIRGELRPGHAGDDLDARAAAEYRSRLAELEREIDTTAAEPESLDALRAEADFIRRELVAAHGLGGRRRRSVDDVERLRKTVSSRIRQSAERIARLHPVLGEHLRESVQTGTFCVYEPRKPVEWAIEE